MNNTKTIDVLIAGAGPVGTALAIDLARRGLDIRIVDRAPHSFDGSRAKGVQPRTLEVLDDLGAIDDILTGGSVYPLLGVHVGPATIPWRMFPKGRESVAAPFPDTWLIPQFRTDRALHDRLRGLGKDVEFGKRLTTFAQCADAVTAQLETDDGMEEVTARYLVGADGGSSTVRKQLGVGFAGSTDEQDRMLIVDAVVTGLSRDRWHIWPGVRGRFLGACPLPHSDLFQIMLRLAPGEEPPTDQEEITQRIRVRTHNRRITLQEVRWSSVFRPNIRLAEHYRRGRVLLAGDAAHVHTPAGAQGLNTGIQDAYNLGWKLALVLAGGDDQLLDTYAAERLPIAANVLGLSTRKYQALAKPAPSGMRRGAEEQQLTLSYHGGPLAPAGSERTKTLRVGDRAPDADLSDAQGRKVWLFEAFRGPHFTAIAYGARAAADLARLEWPSAAAPLRRIVVDATAPRADYVLTDPAHTFRRGYGLTGDTLLLIRPDGYLGHIATADPLSTTRTAVQTLTGSPALPAHQSS